MAKAQIHYDIKPLLKTEANIYLLVGEKSNGKSYQIKNEVAIPNYLENNMRFSLVRRWDSDMPNSWISQYFNDVDVRKVTKDKYDCICPYRKGIYFGNFDEEKMREKPKEKMGYIMPLSMEQHFSGGSYLDVDCMIFEEFMERGGLYLKNEPSRLMALYSTIDRKRGKTKLFLVGNTVSRSNPYLKEWGLDKIFRKMKPRRY